MTLIPSIISSSTPVTVTVWGVSQFEGVKNSDEGEIDISLESAPNTDMTTFEDGCVSSTTVRVSVVPDSETAVELFD